MAEIDGISNEWGLDSAQSQFTEVRNSIEKKALLEEAKVELAENPNDVLAGEIDALSLEAEIEKRFNSLNSQQQS